MCSSIIWPYSKPLKLIASTATVVLLAGWPGGVGAQTTADALPQQEASLSAAGTPANPPSLPLGPDDVREVQNQLISLGFDPGPADGVVGPATMAAAQRYDQNRGGDGRVSIDAEFLARLQADPGARLTYDQVAARSQSYARSPSQEQRSAPAAASNQFGNVVQQIVPLIGAAIANSNTNLGYGYGAGYYGPGYYGPPPRYHGYGYGGY